jgi:tRNA threonylcarbamoyladenosine biosynthesis protein TsaB
MELAIDTSTDFAGVALSEKGTILIELAWFSGQNHTTELLPNVDRIMKQRQIQPGSIEAIYVAVGPGSFNGLRVGLSSAKGFALSLNIPIVGVSTMEVEAYPFAFTRIPVCAVHTAGRGEIASSTYRQTGVWECIETEHVSSVETLVESIKEETIFCGEIPESVLEILKLQLKSKAIVPDPVSRLRRPGYLAALGWQRLSIGQTDDPATLQPIYLRQPPITQRKDKLVNK